MQKPDWIPTTATPLQQHRPGNGADMIKWIMAHILETDYKIIEIAYGTYAIKKVYRINLR